MKELNDISLMTENAQAITEKLNVLLANYQIFYMNIRGFHWNIKGERFFELHAKFEEMYTDALEKIDEIAERILSLGSTPVHAFSEYLELSDIKEVKNISDAYTCVSSIVGWLRAIITLEREIVPLTDQDEGTNSIITDYIKGQEKLLWMYSSYLKS